MVVGSDGQEIYAGDIVKLLRSREMGDNVHAIVERAENGEVFWGIYPYCRTEARNVALVKSNKNKQREANLNQKQVGVESPNKQVVTGIKNDAGKSPISYTPSEFILGIADVFAFGSRKYSAHNYRLGMDHSRILDASLRHHLAILRGEEIDPESGLPHVYHAGCSLAMYDYMRLHHPEKCDIFEILKKRKKD